MRERIEAAGEELAQVEELQLLRALAAARRLPQVVHLPLGRSLAEVHRVAQESEVRLAQEGRQHARVPAAAAARASNTSRMLVQISGGQRLLQQPAHLLDHRQPVRGLHARPLQPVVEDRIFVGGQVQLRRLLHHLHADKVGVTVGQQAVGVVDAAAQQADDHVQHDLAANRPPEVLRQPLVQDRVFDAIENPGRNHADAGGQSSHQDAENEAPRHHRASRLPQNAEHGRYIAQSDKPLAPRARGGVWLAFRHRGR